MQERNYLVEAKLINKHIVTKAFLKPIIEIKKMLGISDLNRLAEMVPHWDNEMMSYFNNECLVSEALDIGRKNGFCGHFVCARIPQKKFERNYFPIEFFNIDTEVTAYYINELKCQTMKNIIMLPTMKSTMSINIVLVDENTVKVDGYYFPADVIDKKKCTGEEYLNSMKPKGGLLF